MEIYNTTKTLSSISTTTIILLAILLLPYPTNTTAEQPPKTTHTDKTQQKTDYWRQLTKKADQLYGGWNLAINLNGGVEHREYYQGTRTGPYGALELSIPLYSKKEKISHQSEKQRYLEHAADLIRTLEENHNSIQISEKKANVLKVMIKDEGISAAEKYFAVLADIANNKTAIKTAERKLEAMLK